MGDDLNLEHVRNVMGEYSGSGVLLPQAEPGNAVVDRWLRTTASWQTPPLSGPLLEGLRVAALVEAATVVWAHNHGLIAKEAQLFSDAAARRRGLDPGRHRNAGDAMARALLAGPSAACIAVPAVSFASNAWSDILRLMGGDPGDVVQAWAEHIVYLTGERTWFTVVEVANELLGWGRLSGERLTNAIIAGRIDYDDLRHDYAFEGLQRARLHMLSCPAEALEMALQKASASRP